MKEGCTLYKTVNFIGKKWTLLIILELYKMKNKKRFSEIKRNFSQITSKILSSRLKELEKEKLIKKTIDNSTIPIKCEYSLTKNGREFVKVLKEMKTWALKNKFNNKLCESRECFTCNL
jgi:DNA-binding HxlR family transcriptional regulator